jgi:hypothetical protein
MAYRRIGDAAVDRAERDKQWSQAESLLRLAIELQYTDSETYGIYGGLVKQKLINAADHLSDAAIVARLFHMRDLYRKGWEADPTYYTGVNVVMTSRIIHAHTNNTGDLGIRLGTSSLMRPSPFLNFSPASPSPTTRTISGPQPLRPNCFFMRH